ncbi:MAG: NigD-like C-terminal domain-containing protein [Bacteroidales bacterium]|nr:NigD-like C-terminal domain-containing protein [Bacteroidales bacterium]
MKWCLAIILGMTLLASCGNDAPAYPDLVTSFVDMRISSGHREHWMQTDDGQQYAFTSSCNLDDFVRDSLYRVVCRFELLDAQNAKVYAVAKTLSSYPQHHTDFQTDPVKVQSVWQSGTYLNMVLEVMAHDAKHDFGFAIEQIDDTNMRITFIHDRKNDIEGFYEKVYASVPLSQYAEWIDKGNALEFCVNTYEGMQSYTVRPF